MKQVLILEDSSDTRALYKRALEIEGFNVADFGHGADAFAHLESHPLPDLIVLDLTLPDMTGGDFLKKLRARAPWAKAKVLVVSGRENVAEEAREFGADGHLRKPFDLDKLYSEVGRFVN